MARKVETKQAVLWMQMQQVAQVAACVDSTSRTVQVWMPSRQILALVCMLRRQCVAAGAWPENGTRTQKFTGCER